MTVPVLISHRHDRGQPQPRAAAHRIERTPTISNPVVSTSHLSEQTAHLLDCTKADEWSCRGDPYCYYGWFVYAQDENPGIGSDAIPDDLFAVMTWAREHRFDYILFDRGADTVDALPTYSW